MHFKIQVIITQAKTTTTTTTRTTIWTTTICRKHPGPFAGIVILVHLIDWQFLYTPRCPNKVFCGLGIWNFFSAFLEEMDCFPNISYTTCCDWTFSCPELSFIARARQVCWLLYLQVNEVTNAKTTVGKQPTDSAFACRNYLRLLKLLGIFWDLGYYCYHSIVTVE